MREYNFRVWDTENKEMLKVQELDFEDTFYGGRLSIRTDQYNDYFDIEDMILMQYTGLKDKNGKEIYEGDIIFIKGETKLLDIKGKVEYSNTFAQFIITNTGSIVNETEPLGDYEEENIEVIGNIYDNPELLEEGD
mgnify:FL=1